MTKFVTWLKPSCVALFPFRQTSLHDSKKVYLAAVDDQAQVPCSCCGTGE